MIDKQLLTRTVEEAIAGTDMFIVDIQVKPGNAIVVELDSETSIDIDTCAQITHKIESVFDRDVEDYELEVGSAGLTADFKVHKQYLKNVGNDVEILTRGGRKFTANLKSVGDDDFTVTYQMKEKPQGAKRPVLIEKEETLKMADCKYVRYAISFK